MPFDLRLFLHPRPHPCPLRPPHGRSSRWVTPTSLHLSASISWRTACLISARPHTMGSIRSTRVRWLIFSHFFDISYKLSATLPPPLLSPLMALLFYFTEKTETIRRGLSHAPTPNPPSCSCRYPYVPFRMNNLPALYLGIGIPDNYVSSSLLDICTYISNGQL